MPGFGAKLLIKKTKSIKTVSSSPLGGLKI